MLIFRLFFYKIEKARFNGTFEGVGIQRFSTREEIKLQNSAALSPLLLFKK